MTMVSSRDFNRDSGPAKRAARNGPVFITDRTRPAYVLLTIEEYRRITGPKQSLADLLGAPDDTAADFEIPQLDIKLQIPTFD